MRKIFIDQFSGRAAGIKPKERSVETLVKVLRQSPRISAWDFSENPWLHRLVKDAVGKGMISEVDEPYPWRSYIVNDAQLPSNKAAKGAKKNAVGKRVALTAGLVLELN